MPEERLNITEITDIDWQEIVSRVLPEFSIYSTNDCRISFSHPELTYMNPLFSVRIETIKASSSFKKVPALKFSSLQNHDKVVRKLTRENIEQRLKDYADECLKTYRLKEETIQRRKEAESLTEKTKDLLKEIVGSCSEKKYGNFSVYFKVENNRITVSTTTDLEGVKRLHKLFSSVKH